MIPQSFKDIISNGENVSLLQTIATIVFSMLFIGIILYVFSRPKKFYQNEENAPLDSGEEDDNILKH